MINPTLTALEIARILSSDPCKDREVEQIYIASPQGTPLTKDSTSKHLWIHFAPMPGRSERFRADIFEDVKLQQGN